MTIFSSLKKRLTTASYVYRLSPIHPGVQITKLSIFMLLWLFPLNWMPYLIICLYLPFIHLDTVYHYSLCVRFFPLISSWEPCRLNQACHLSLDSVCLSHSNAMLISTNFPSPNKLPLNLFFLTFLLHIYLFHSLFTRCSPFPLQLLSPLSFCVHLFPSQLIHVFAPLFFLTHLNQTTLSVFLTYLVVQSFLQYPSLHWCFPQ